MGRLIGLHTRLADRPGRYPLSTPLLQVIRTASFSKSFALRLL